MTTLSTTIYSSSLVSRRALAMVDSAINAAHTSSAGATAKVAQTVFEKAYTISPQQKAFNDLKTNILDYIESARKDLITYSPAITLDGCRTFLAGLDTELQRLRLMGKKVNEPIPATLMNRLADLEKEMLQYCISSGHIEPASYENLWSPMFATAEALSKVVTSNHSTEDELDEMQMEEAVGVGYSLNFTNLPFHA